MKNLDITRIMTHPEPSSTSSQPIRFPLALPNLWRGYGVFFVSRGLTVAIRLPSLFSGPLKGALEPAAEGTDGGLLDVGDDVAVDVQGGRGVGVADDRRDRPDINARAEERGRRRMPGVVEAGRGELRLAGQAIEGAARRHGRDVVSDDGRAAARLREALGNGERRRLNIDVAPGERAELAPTRPCREGEHHEALPACARCDLEQIGNLVVGECLGPVLSR
jgi:hypothetical protein